MLTSTHISIFNENYEKANVYIYFDENNPLNNYQYKSGFPKWVV